jgi:acylphosphatase
VKRINIKIYGRVQGVGFRYAAEHEAHKLSVTASARNEPDGSVSIEVEGEKAALQKFVAWCHRGPWLAKVERVEVS